ncbi:MAG: MarR family transcriptional regulator [Candidatus Nephthysia bennettiae]|uniref:MarR family transcriptional regulator n=1 Tax=Candidatus Nephthysia bennettiae TaxID=3127016 RepID=A0A934NC87_9BACT|nr:MarR family transcriptional regulator [Candidatus Dormibacteraeota bacterium]MBJ7614714.1 MarR family transcriptional regulator [Candidatus Dormibacteraeota bacterium]PZR94631.1 MAG: MarR family transcriptional regulator [Candidatus Dormibacteraeota bacterium]
MGESKGRRLRVTVDLLRELAANLDALNNAASPHAGLNRTDLRALDIIAMQESLTAGQLAARLKLTTGAITGVLDRLERAGQAVRTHDTEDRRRVVVQPTEQAKGESYLAFPGLATDFERLLGEYSDEERQVIDGFLRRINRTVAERADQLSSQRRER